MKPILILKSARLDIQRAKAFYRRINPDLSRRFQMAVETAITAIGQAPLAMQVQHFDIRRWPLDKFPHGVLYKVEDDQILVLAVFHPNQDPQRWQEIASST